MKTIQHDTWAKIEWEVGDLVRLKTSKGRPGAWDHVEEGSFGRVTDARSWHWLEVSLHGYSHSPDSIAGLVRCSDRDLELFVRKPEDDAAIHENVVRALKSLAWMDVIEFTRHPTTGWTTIVGHGQNMMSGTRTIGVTDVVLPDLLPYLGDGSLDAGDRQVWTVNAAGHALLDSHDVPHEVSLAGGGNNFKLSWSRRGVFTITDTGTGNTQAFDGEKAHDLLVANRTNVRMIHDGKMPDIARQALDYPRTLRGGNLKVIEINDVDVEVHHPDGTAVFEGKDAKKIRQACGRVNDLLKWFDSRIDELEPVSASTPSMR